MLLSGPLLQFLNEIFALLSSSVQFEAFPGENFRPFEGDIDEANVRQSHCGLSEEAATHVYSELECIRDRLQVRKVYDAFSAM